MELFEMLLKGFGQGQQSQQQPQQEYYDQQEALRQQQQYQNLQRDMQNQYQGGYQAPSQDQFFSGDLGEIAGKLGVSPDKVQQIIKMALPLIMGQLGQNVESDDGARSLSDALQNHANRQYRSTQDIDEQDGKGILGHIFGDNATDRVSERIGQEAGVDKNNTMKILTMLAPLALAFLARKKQNEHLDERGVKDLTRRYSDEINDRTGGSLYDALRQLPEEEPQQQAPGGLLGSILGGLFGN
ncbi:DUF937 domain-containing protein [Proteiniclasticum sp. QWL-01]|uniref:DUF937 domain-containing protein n=1 Tax=Proteiniclasticum sp. QWL-01 TaxID=3036945 RepID=UPI002209E2BB|nr:DUF937 domain-containing protein [Proteiniclasticum sp. QWL-01]UUM11234.1 DUF937 domain-containing protein [Clostridiaceae bacterium HFYG-1003]WFF72572.1 DUF937 domain-containing protein [Proteiniclasticum sp. QWL-01]